MNSQQTSPRSAFSSQTDSVQAASEIVQKLAAGGTAQPRCVVFFAGLAQDGAAIGGALQAQFPSTQVIGCSANGEFSDGHYGKGGVAALALYEDSVGQVATVLAPLSAGVRTGIADAARRLGEKLGRPLRSLDAQHFIGIGLLEGATGREEAINEALGNAAPLLPFVGGSAGDNITFSGTWVFAEGRVERDACALLVLECRRPFTVLKTCNFVATPVEVTITRADPARRLIIELDGQPAVQRYAELIGAKPEELAFAHFLANPLGLMIDDEPWLRSAVRPEGSALFFACAVLEGMTLNLMRATDIVENAGQALAQAAVKLGGPPRAALLFNCAYRMLEVQIRGVEPAYHAALAGVVHAGLHSNGESYLGHINQTLTGLILG